MIVRAMAVITVVAAVIALYSLPDLSVERKGEVAMYIAIGAALWAIIAVIKILTRNRRP